MATIITQQNDSVDSLSYRAFGDSSAVEAILELNHGLADIGAQFSAGLTVLLPEAAPKAATPALNLWD